MTELPLRIHPQGKETHEITAPDDIVSMEFIAELIRVLRLPEVGDDGKPIIWEADDKDSGRTLIRERTLRDNGVLAGHNLYLRPTTPSPQTKLPLQPPIIPPEPPRPPNSSWLLWVALILIPVAGFAGYYGAGSKGDQGRKGIQAQLRQDQILIDNMKSQSQALEARAAQLESDLAKLRQDVAAKTGDTTKLQFSLTQKDALLALRDKRIVQLTAESSESQRLLNASAQKLQDVQGELNAAKQAAVAERQRVQQQLQAVAGLQQQLNYERNRPRFGFLTWTGTSRKEVVEIRGNRCSSGSLKGALPGIEVTVEATDPERAEILLQPGADNKWIRLAFRVEGNSKAPVRFLWVAK